MATVSLSEQHFDMLVTERGINPAVVKERGYFANSKVVEDFARAVAKQETSALLIGPDNRLLGWVSIDQAIRLGLSFAVEVSDDVLALDADDQMKRTLRRSRTRSISGR